MLLCNQNLTYRVNVCETRVTRVISGYFNGPADLYLKTLMKR